MNKFEPNIPDNFSILGKHVPEGTPAGNGSVFFNPQGFLIREIPDVIPLPGVDPSAAGCERWYVVHTQSHAEDRAIGNLERQAFKIFCPRMRKTLRHARKLSQIEVPLFPSYLFVRLNMQRDRWHCINGTRGVIRIIAQGDVPSPVPPGVVEALKSRMDGEGAAGFTPSLKAGDTVRICEGPFAEFIGTLEHLDGVGRVRVLLDLMGRAVLVVARPHMVVPAV